MTSVRLRTGVWYNDRETTLTFPQDWDVATYWPRTPPPLSDEHIAAAVANPVDQPPLRELADGKTRPVVIVDDLSRPTPIYRLLPFLLDEFEKAGISPGDVLIVVAPGTHGRQDFTALKKKLGPEAFEKCRVSIHNDRRKTRMIGRTSFGTPVLVNHEILAADLVVGIGGVYPQHTSGFGGGAKLALGVLGRKSIARLHFGHPGVDGSYDIDNSFRDDVTEIARMIGLNCMFTAHVNAEQELVNLICGDHFTYYPRAAQFSREQYDAPTPDDADVVIASAYPSDISVFFMRKAMKPLDCAPPSASTIMIASNHEGLGRHGLFHAGRNPRLNAVRTELSRILSMDSQDIWSRVLNRFASNKQAMPAEQPPAPVSRSSRRLWVYSPPGGYAKQPPAANMTIVDDWNRLLEIIRQEQSNKSGLRVRIYPSASLQCMDAAAISNRQPAD